MANALDPRSITLLVEEIYHERGPAPPEPLRRGAVMAVLRNPFAGRYEPAIVHSPKRW